MKTTLIKYGHDSRLYSGEIKLSDYYIYDNEDNRDGSPWARRIVKDKMFDLDCENKCKYRDGSYNRTSKHPWRCGYL